MSSKENKQKGFSSASIAAAAFNLPVMVIAGLIIGYLLSVGQEPPLRELILIGSPILFFAIAIIELYYVANKQQFQQFRSKSSHGRGLAKLITAEEEEE